MQHDDTGQGSQPKSLHPLGAGSAVDPLAINAVPRTAAVQPALPRRTRTTIAVARRVGFRGSDPLCVMSNLLLTGTPGGVPCWVLLPGTPAPEERMDAEVAVRRRTGSPPISTVTRGQSGGRGAVYSPSEVQE
jgi:hypothetical protein